MKPPVHTTSSMSKLETLGKMLDSDAGDSHVTARKVLTQPPIVAAYLPPRPRTVLRSHAQLPEHSESPQFFPAKRINVSSTHISSNKKGGIMINRHSGSTYENEASSAPYHVTNTIGTDKQPAEGEILLVNLNLFYESVKAIFKNKNVDYESLLRRIEK